MNMTIDGHQVAIREEDANIVQVADRAGIKILAPCYRAKRKRGCCKACVVEIDGQQHYACATRPQDGMDMVIRRADLDALRKERLKAYRDNMDTPLNNCDCDCSGDMGCAPGPAGASCC